MNYAGKKKYLLLTLFIVISLSIFLVLFFLTNKTDPVSNNYYNIPEEDRLSLSIRENQIEESRQTETESSTTAASQPQSPEQALLEVPFLVQAPFANWDELHEEACEEASLIMLKHYIKKEKITSKEQADAEITQLIGLETNSGYKVDATTGELSEIANKFFGLKTGRVKTNATIEDIKKEISSGRPVIVPAAGKILPNPNFRNGGPNYHMLVIKGFDKNGFITNDPGTRKGEGFRYAFDDLYEAIHDWNPNDIMLGGKNYLVFD